MSVLFGICVFGTWVSSFHLGGRPIMVSHGLPGGLVGSSAYLYRFALRVFGFRVLLAGLCASQ